MDLCTAPLVYCDAEVEEEEEYPAPQRATAVAGPVKIPPQFESFYTFPIF